MKASISNQIYISDIPEALSREITEQLTLPNPKWLENQKMGRWNGRTPRFLTFYERDIQGLTVPRGFIGQLVTMARRHQILFQLEDNRRTLPEVPFEFHGQLRDFQSDALADTLPREFGTLQAPTGAGKTVIALGAIAERKQPALVVVHTKELLNQWLDRIETFLEIPKDRIGQIGAGKQAVGDWITVSTVQSLYRCAKEVAPCIGHLIVDECHRAPSRTFTEAVSAFDSKYMLGLSATPWRRDGLSRLIYWYLGDLVHEVNREALQDQGHIVKARVVWKQTDYQTQLDPSEQYSKMLSELTRDPDRNSLIARDVTREAWNGGGVCLVLTDRKEHARTLQQILTSYDVRTAVLTGEVSRKRREAIVKALNKREIKAVCATGHIIGEGFDCKGLSTLFLATPIKFNGRVLQYLGRILRPAPGKETATVYDYVDRHVGPLVAGAKARARTYRQAGVVE
ncbi:MAG: DEAD/DEAH box helicase [Desulfobacteraceae bacterium]